MTAYRVDDLARAAGTTARNVRLYQERGLLPPPRREGRLGWYDDSHLARLRLITRLLDRGFSLANIAELLSTWESGRDLSNVLGVEQVLTMPWNDEDPAPVTMSGLRKAFGPDFGTAEADRLVEIGLLQRHGARYQLPSPALLGVAHELVAAGMPIAAVLRLAETLVNHLTAVARDFIVTTTEAFDGPAGSGGELSAEDVDRMAKLADRLRPLATLAVTRGFSVAMDRATAELLDVAIATRPPIAPARPDRGSS
jgi:DNA-binding transcriptional MerR regulator